MKATIWVICISLVLVMGMGITTSILSSHVARDYAELAEQLEDLVREEEWDEARKLLNKIEVRWEDTCQWLQFWVNHGDTDDVNLGLGQMDVGIELKNIWICLTAGAELRESFRHLYHRDALTLSNIL